MIYAKVETYQLDTLLNNSSKFRDIISSTMGIANREIWSFWPNLRKNCQKMGFFCGFSQKITQFVNQILGKLSPMSHIPTIKISSDSDIWKTRSYYSKLLILAKISKIHYFYQQLGLIWSYYTHRFLLNCMYNIPTCFHIYIPNFKSLWYLELPKDWRVLKQVAGGTTRRPHAYFPTFPTHFWAAPKICIQGHQCMLNSTMVVTHL